MGGDRKSTWFPQISGDFQFMINWSSSSPLNLHKLLKNPSKFIYSPPPPTPEQENHLQVTANSNTSSDSVPPPEQEHEKHLQLKANTNNSSDSAPPPQQEQEKHLQATGNRNAFAELTRLVSVSFNSSFQSSVDKSTRKPPEAAKRSPFSEISRWLTLSLAPVIPSWPPQPSVPPSPSRSISASSSVEAVRAIPRFRPYVAKVPWHGGVRAFLSQLFPRYGHYCGPNWSSGKAGGSMLWDRRPIDWLDYCCYCHDIGYDTHDQAKLLQADLAFLECLEKPRMVTRGNPQAAVLYRSMCIVGLRNVLIPYRMQLLNLQEQRNPLEMLGNMIGKGFRGQGEIDSKHHDDLQMSSKPVEYT